MKIFKISYAIVAIIFFIYGPAIGEGTLIELGSIEYDSGNDEEANAVAVDSQDNIIVAGYTNTGSGDDMLIIKYSSDLVVLSSASYAGAAGSADSAAGVAVDNYDNIIVTGYTYNGADDDYFTIKYDNDLTVLSSATYDSGGSDKAYAVTTDSNYNIIVAGKAGGDVYTIKYSTNLIMISSAAYNTPYEMIEVAIDSDDNIIVSGTDYATKYSSALEEIYTIVKNDISTNYFENDPDLKIVQSNVAPGWDVAVDSADNILLSFISIVEFEVTAGPDIGTYGSKNGNIVKFDPDGNLVLERPIEVKLPLLNVVCYSLAVDSSDNIIDSGKKVIESEDYFFTRKFNSDLTVIAADRRNDPGRSYGLATDGSNNIIAVGYTDNGTDGDWLTVKYRGSPPSVSSVSPVSLMRGERKSIVITGEGFYEGADVSFNGSGITVNSVIVDSLTRLKVSITADEDAKLGKRDVTVTNIDTQADAKADCIRITSNTEIDKDIKNTVTLEAESGDIVVEIPAHTFSENIDISVKVSDVPAVGRDTLKKSDIGVEIEVSSGELPLKDITLKIYYRDEDIAGLDEDKLAICRYDSANSRWIPFETTVYASKNYLEASINHLSKFGILQLAAASDLDSVKVFPNPYDPGSGMLIFDNLTAEATIKIYTVAGTLVKELKEADGNGRCEWDGKNAGSETVASGVYLAYVSSSAGDKIVKIAVVK